MVNLNVKDLSQQKSLLWLNSATELIKKDEVNIIIESKARDHCRWPGKLTKDTVSVDATLTNIKVKVGDVVPIWRCSGVGRSEN
ncbi:MAG: hypothetical protein IPJ13_14380 [Saprospiraceae bacterium]|nr:hypothetical protein [Saprospiraceae bacterium]